MIQAVCSGERESESQNGRYDSGSVGRGIDTPIMKAEWHDLACNHEPVPYAGEQGGDCRGRTHELRSCDSQGNIYAAVAGMCLLCKQAVCQDCRSTLWAFMFVFASVACMRRWFDARDTAGIDAQDFLGGSG